jgi:glucan biosynthesis protein C
VGDAADRDTRTGDPLDRETGAGGRIVYLDRIRVFLTAIVILHHFAITYGAPGDWFYVERPVDPVATFALLPLVAINQSYFMGFFFLLSAYLLPASVRRRGRRQVGAERLVRLGIPLVVYTVAINPLVEGLAAAASSTRALPPVHDLPAAWIAHMGTGPMWFVAVLLVLTALFLLLDRRRDGGGPKTPPLRPARAAPLRPTIVNTTLFALGLGLLSFMVRIVAPMGVWVPDLVEPAHLPQYAALFAVGALAGARGWSGEIDPRLERYWSVLLPVSFVLCFAAIGLSLESLSDFDAVMGGWSVAAAVYALWEHLWCVGIIIVLLGVFRRRFAGTSPRLEVAALDSYATYVLHPLVLVGLALALGFLPLPALAKFALFAPVAVLAAFALGHLARSLPGARRVL